VQKLSPSLNIQHSHDAGTEGYHYAGTEGYHYAGTEGYVSTTAVNTYIKVKKRTIQRP